MKVIITDVRVLMSVQTTVISKYLTRRGWEPRPNEGWTRGRATIWIRQTPRGNIQEVLVPDSKGFRDYPQRVAELLADLATYEGRSQLAILRDVSERPWKIDWWLFLLTLHLVAALAIAILYSGALWSFPSLYALFAALLILQRLERSLSTHYYSVYYMHKRDDDEWETISSKWFRD